MSTEELALQMIRDAADKLKAEWAKEAVAGPLDDEGDAVRRLAATKTHVIDQLVIQLRKAITHD